MKKLNIGIIGLGRIGKVHLENLIMRIPEAEVSAVAEINLPEVKAIAKRYGIKGVMSDYRELLAIQSLDAVVICSSTDTHTQIIKEAAAANKHLFCETPIDLNLDNIRQALEAVEKSGIKFMVGFNRRFDPNFLKIKEMVASGKIGQTQILKITSRDPAPPPLEYIQGSGGMFVDMSIHDFDMARHLVESEIKEVFTRAQVFVDEKIGEAGDYDTAITLLSFENGAIGTVDNCRKAVYGYDQRVEVFGSEGMVGTENNTPDRHFYLNPEGVHSALPLHFFMQRYTASYVNEMKEFIQAVVMGKDFSVTGADGLQSMRVALAAKKSAQEQRTVRLSEIN
jgi:myo-inositol 2-dehydrogenase/D-chiro-inositol 1-dehydrogenase